MSTSTSTVVASPLRRFTDDMHNVCNEITGWQHLDDIPTAPVRAILDIVAGPEFPGYALVSLSVERFRSVGLHIDSPGITDFHEALDAAVMDHLGTGTAVDVQIELQGEDGPLGALQVRSRTGREGNIAIDLIAHPDGDDPGGSATIELPYRDVQCLLVPSLTDQIRRVVESTRESRVEVGGKRYGRPVAGSRLASFAQDARLLAAATAGFPRLSTVTVQAARDRDLSVYLDPAALAELEEVLANAVDYYRDAENSVAVDYTVEALDIHAAVAGVHVMTTSDYGNNIQISLLTGSLDRGDADVANIELGCADVKKTLIPAIRDDLRPRFEPVKAAA